jgi:hypothetical protein
MKESKMANIAIQQRIQNFFTAETEWERFSGPEHSDSIERNYPKSGDA